MIELENAIGYACAMLKGKKDKCDQPLIFHTLRMIVDAETTDEQITAALHDVIEDSDASFDDLVSLSVPDNIINAINALTKRDGENYDKYLERVKSNNLALRVKLIDLRDNLSPARQWRLSPTKTTQLKLKYKAALEYLLTKENKTIVNDIQNGFIDFIKWFTE